MKYLTNQQLKRQLVGFRRRISFMVLKLIAGFMIISILLVLPFRWLDPSFSMVMVDRYWQLSHDEMIYHQWCDWSAIPPHAVLAVVAAEDQAFLSHAGFDFSSIWRAVKAGIAGEKLRGASTISQQVARNMYLWTGRSWFRKGLEVWFTLLIELFWGKQRILEVYLNIAEWGRGVFGIAAASQFHFKQDIQQLSSDKIALLAVSLPNPIHYQPAKPSAYLLQRARWNRQQQKSLGGIQWLADIYQ